MFNFILLFIHSLCSINLQVHYLLVKLELQLTKPQFPYQNVVYQKFYSNTTCEDRKNTARRSAIWSQYKIWRSKAAKACPRNVQAMDQEISACAEEETGSDGFVLMNPLEIRRWERGWYDSRTSRVPYEIELGRKDSLVTRIPVRNTERRRRAENILFFFFLSLFSVLTDGLWVYLWKLNIFYIKNAPTCYIYVHVKGLFSVKFYIDFY